ncbi:MAG: hypothetical protein MOGMAGMI_00425 [Candidatus Omnitrophica bacterium]|nr:hypothetical protein [Candidatus Omnitrophota bacterium]
MRTRRTTIVLMLSLLSCAVGVQAAESKRTVADIQKTFGDDPERFSRTLKAISNLSRSGALQSLSRTSKAAPGMKGKRLTGGAYSPYGLNEAKEAGRRLETKTKEVVAEKKSSWGY